MKLFIYTLLALIPAFAGAADVPDTLVRDVSLAEISVTALKSSSRTPLAAEAVTLVSASDIERLNIVSMKDVSEIAPNFYMPAYGSRMTASIYMRGLGARIDQPAVGLIVDNVPLLNKDAFDFDMPDINSIEVIRGPGSAMHGRNTMAGLINVATLSPMQYQGIRISAEAASYNNYRLAAGIYTRPATRFATSLTLAANYAGGYFINRHSGARADREKSFYARWRAIWRPSASLSLDNTASFNTGHQNGYPYASVETGLISYNDTCFYRRTTFSDGLTVAWRPSAAISLTSATSLQYIDDNMTLDQDFTTLSYFTLTQRRHEIALTQDVFLKTFSHRYNSTSGIFAFYKHGDMAAPVTFKADGIDRLIISHRNEINPQHPVVWNSDSFILSSQFKIPVKGFAIYHSSSFDLSSRWSLDAAIRLDYEHSALDYHSLCNTAYTTVNAASGAHEAIHPIDIDKAGRLSTHFLQLLPRLAATFRPKTGLDIYASIAKGYKSGGYNTQMFSDVLQQDLMEIMGLTPQYDTDRIVSYKPEKCWNFEIGSHFISTCRRLSIDFAAFYIDCRDQQLTMFPNGTTTGRIMTNAGHTRSAGVEITSRFSPSKAWSFNASWGFTDARFIKFNNGLQDYSGNRIPYSPANTLYFGATYRRPLRSGIFDALSLNANIRGIGDICWDENGDDRQPFYAIAAASARLDARHISIDLWADNITDTKFVTFLYKSIGNKFKQHGRPFTFGVTLKLNFDFINN